MSEKPPREFYIYVSTDGDELLARNRSINMDKRYWKEFHVIEKSAYDELERKGQRLCVGLGNTMMEAEKLRKERDAWKGQAEKLEEALEFYADFASGKKHQFIFDDETSSRAAVYERYKEHSMGDLGIKAMEALAQFEAFKKSLNE